MATPPRLPETAHRPMTQLEKLASVPDAFRPVPVSVLGNYFFEVKAILDEFGLGFAKVDGVAGRRFFSR